MTRSLILLTTLIAVVTAAPALADTQGSLFDSYAIAVSPDGAHVYAGQGGGTGYVVLKRDAATGGLTYVSKPTFPGANAGSGGDPRRSIAVSPDGRAVYDAVNGSNSLRMMSVSGSSVSPGATYANYTNDISGMSGPMQVAVSGDGECVYVTAIYSSPTSIVAFKRDPATSQLTYGSTYTTSGYEHFNEMSVTAAGDHLYAAAGSGVQAFSRDRATCALASLGVTGPGGQITGLAISPTDQNVYAVDPSGKRLRVFDRDPVSGTLTLSQTLERGVAGVTGIDGVNGVVVSPDGKNVYTTASNENAVAVFTRSADGSLTQRDVRRDGEGGVSGIAKATSLVIAPDGGSVHVSASAPTGAVTSFRRDPSTGDLHWVNSVTDDDAPSTDPTGEWTGTAGPSPGGNSPTGPLPPAGPVGVSMNDGRQYTNDADVRVGIVWPLGASNLLVANDGGFRTAATLPVAATIPWKLDSSGPERLPKTIYVRFGASSQTFTDDIILDETDPVVRSARLSSAGAGTAAVAAASRARLKLRLRASDRTSGVYRAQLARKKTRPQKPMTYRSAVSLKGSPPRFVRVRDRAGNWSRWRRISRVRR